MSEIDCPAPRREVLSRVDHASSVYCWLRHLTLLPWNYLSPVHRHCAVKGGQRQPGGGSEPVSGEYQNRVHRRYPGRHKRAADSGRGR